VITGKSAAGAQAIADLKRSDRKLAALIERVGPIDPVAWRKGRPLGDAFSALVYSIIGQQISGFAARAIAGRLQEHFGGRMPSPAELASADPTDLRAVGLSRMKIEYLRSLAEHVIAGDLQVDKLSKLSGIRSAIKRLYRLDHLPTEKEVDEIGQKWSPHRTLASFYLWASTREP
jgi:DNA-3-methyladenine glycosylase II